MAKKNAAAEGVFAVFFCLYSLRRGVLSFFKSPQWAIHVTGINAQLQFRSKVVYLGDSLSVLLAAEFKYL